MCQEPVAMLLMLSAAHTALLTPWSKEALGQGCMHTTMGLCNKCTGGPQTWLCFSP